MSQPHNRDNTSSQTTSGRLSLRLVVFGRHTIVATKDQLHDADAQWICHQIQLELFAIPSPIHINSHPLLRTATTYICTPGRGKNSAVAHRKRKCYNLNPLSSFQNEENTFSLTLSYAGLSLLQMLLEAYKKKYLISSGGPKPFLRGPVDILTTMHLPQRQNPPLSKTQTHWAIPTPLNTQFQVRDTPNCEHQTNSSPFSQNPLMSYTRHVDSIMDPRRNLSEPITTKKHENTKQVPQLLPTNDTTDTCILPEITPLPSSASRPLLNTRLSGRKYPTRRSQRLQEKERANCALTKPLPKVKNKVVKLPFDSLPLEVPIDTATAIEILQASGLLINQEVEDKI